MESTQGRQDGAAQPAAAFTLSGITGSMNFDFAL